MAGSPAASGVALSGQRAAPAWRWRGGDPHRRGALAPLVDALLGDGEGIRVLREKPGRRRLARGRLESGEEVFAKHYAARDPAWKRRLRLTPAAREFRALSALRAAGVAVPEPLAWVEAPGGDELVLLRFLDGEPLEQALRRPPAERRALLRAVGSLVRRMHASGRVHRDLHRENVWVTAEGPVLIDLQASMRVAPRWLVLGDRGELDASLAPLLSLSDRVRLRAALLDVRRPFDAAARKALRAVGRASEARHRAHVESRTRRSLLPGRLYARYACDLGSGMRLRQVDEEGLRDALAATPPSPDARAAWLAGHGLRARGIGAPLPLAFVEGREGGRVLLEPADETRDVAAEEVATLGVALRRHHVAIAEDAMLARDATGRPGPLPLEAVSFPRALQPSLARRIDRFVEREADRAAPDAKTRDACLRRYRLRLRFYDAATTRRR